MCVMSRTKAREIALHLIFEMGFQQFEEENLNERLDEEIMKSISGDIALYAGKHMTIAVLRLALFEMRDVDDVPVGVAINKAVELAKKYDTEDAASFINGVLGSAARAEFPQGKQESTNA